MILPSIHHIFFFSLIVQSFFRFPCYGFFFHLFVYQAIPINKRDDDDDDDDMKR